MSRTWFKRIIILIGVAVALGFVVTSNHKTKQNETVKAISKINEVLGNESYEANVSARSLSLDTSILYQAERELRLYRAFFKDVPIGLLEKEEFDDCNCFKITDFNTAWKSLILDPSGIDSLEYIMSSDFDYWPDSLASLYQKQDQRIMASGKDSMFSAPIQINDTIKHPNWIKYPLGDKLYLIYLSNKTLEEL